MVESKERTHTITGTPLGHNLLQRPFVVSHPEGGENSPDKIVLKGSLNVKEAYQEPNLSSICMHTFTVDETSQVGRLFKWASFFF